MNGAYDFWETGSRSSLRELLVNEGLAVMEEAIQHVAKHGDTEGDSPAYPSGVAGF